MNGDLNLNDHAGAGDRVRRTYMDESLSRVQSERHLRRISEAQRNLAARGPGLSLHRAELTVIAAVAVLALVGVFGWQALRPSEDEGSASGVPSPIQEQSITPTPTVGAVESDQPADGAGFVGGECVVGAYSTHGPPDVSQAAFTDTWHGAGSLWAGLGPENEGIWATDGVRVLWWRAAPAPLDITGQRLDGESPPLEAEIFAGYDGMSHQITSLTFPSAGCWEVTGKAGDQELRFVVDVRPLEESPPYRALQQEIAELERERRELTPHPIPEHCHSAGEWSSPDFRLMGVQDQPDFAFWRDGAGISIGTTHGLLFEGENDLTWMVSPELAPLELTGHGLSVFGVLYGEGLRQLELTVNSTYPSESIRRDRFNRAWHTTVTFPEPGCWTLLLSNSRPDEIVEEDTALTVYVFPRPEEQVSGVPVGDIQAFSEPTHPGEARHYQVSVTADVRSDGRELLEWMVDSWDRMLDDGTRHRHEVARDSEGNIVAEFTLDGEWWYMNDGNEIRTGSVDDGIPEPPAEIWIVATEMRAVGTTLAGPTPFYDETEFSDDLATVTRWYHFVPEYDLDWVLPDDGGSVRRGRNFIEIDQQENMLLRSGSMISRAGDRVSLGTLTYRSLDFMGAGDVDDALFTIAD